MRPCWSGGIPTPVSQTETSTPSAPAWPSPIRGARGSPRCTSMPTRPPSGVNLTALDSRLKTTCFTLRSSASIGDFQLRRLVFERVEQPHVLNGNHGLVGKRLEQFDLAVRERIDLLPANGNAANRFALAQ